MITLVLSLLSFGFTVSAGGTETPDCHCDTYRDLAGIGGLSSQIAAIGLSGIEAPSDERLRALRLRIETNSLIPAECRARLIAEIPRNQTDLFLRGVMGSQATHRSEDLNSGQLARIYDTLYTSYFRYSSCGEGTPPPNNGETAASQPPQTPGPIPTLFPVPPTLPSLGTGGSPSLTTTLGGATSAPPIARGVQLPTLPTAIPGLLPTAPLALTSRACAERSFQEYDRFWSRSPEQLATLMPQYQLPDGSVVGAGEVRLLRTYHQLLNARSERDLLHMVSTRRDGLSNDEFLKVVAMLGDRLSRNYDQNRAEAGVDRGGVVSGDELLAAARTNSAYGDASFARQVGLPDPTGGRFENAGVCRDIGVFQAKILEARGFKNTFVVSWSTRYGLHTNVITQDPDRPRQLYQFNYGDIAANYDRDGSLALFQGSWDATLNYRISDPRGRVMADIPSEMGKFMSEAAGFNIRHFDPLTRTTSSMTSASLPIGRGDHFRAGAVAGMDGTGTRYAGATASAQWNQNTRTPGRVGLVVAAQVRPHDVFMQPNTDVALVAYLQAEQHFQSRPVEVRPGLTFMADSSINGVGGLVRVFGNDRDTLAPGGSLRINTEAQLHHTADQGRYQGTYRAGIQVDPIAVSDVREAQVYRVIRPNLNHVYAQASSSYQVTPSVALVGDVSAVLSNLGARGQIEAGVATERFAATTSVSGRITDSSALVEESSIRRAGARLLYRPNEHTTVGVVGEIPLEGDAVDGARVLGNVALVF